MNLTKRKLVSILTLLVFAVSNYTGVFAINVSGSTEPENIKNTFISKFTEKVKSINEIEAFTNKQPKNQNPENPAPSTDTADTLNGEVSLLSARIIGDITPKYSEEDSTEEDNIKNIIAKEYYGYNRATNNGGHILIPSFEENLHTKAYVIFKPTQTISEDIEVQLNTSGQSKVYSGPFNENERYLFEGISIQNPQDKLVIKKLGSENQLQYDLQILTNVENKIVEEADSEVTEPFNFKLVDGNIVLEWYEYNKDDVPVDQYKNIKVLVDEEEEFFTNITKTEINNASGLNKYTATTAMGQDVTIKTYKIDIFTVNSGGVIGHVQKNLSYGLSNPVSIINKDIPDRFLSEESYDLLIKSNLRLKMINVPNINNGTDEANTIYYSLHSLNSVNEEENLIQLEHLETGDDVTGYSYNLSFNFKSNVRNQGINNLFPGKYKLSIKVKGGIDGEEDILENKTFLVVSSKPTLEVIHGQKNELGVDTPHVNVMAGTESIPNDPNSKDENISFKVSIADEDEIEELCTSITSDTNTEIIYIGNCNDLSHQHQVPMNTSYRLSSEGKYVVKLEHLKTKANFTESDLSEYNTSYEFTFDNKAPIEKVVLLNTDGSVNQSSFDNIVGKNQSLGIQLSDYSIDESNCINNVKLLKLVSNSLVEIPNVQLEYISQSNSYKLTTGSLTDNLVDGDYVLKFDVKDRIGNEKTVTVPDIDNKCFAIDRSDINPDQISYTITSGIEDKVLDKKDNFYYSNDTINIKFKLPMIYGKYENIKVDLETYKLIMNHYSTSREPSNTRKSLGEIAFDSNKLVNKDDYYEYTVSLSKEKLQAYINTNKDYDQIIAKATVHKKGNTDGARVEAINLVYDPFIPEIKEYTNQPVNVNTVVYNNITGSNKIVIDVLQNATEQSIIKDNDKFIVNVTDNYLDNISYEIYQVNKVNNHEQNKLLYDSISNTGSKELSLSGKYQVKIIGTDLVGQKSEKIYTIILDREPPMINLLKMPKSLFNEGNNIQNQQYTYEELLTDKIDVSEINGKSYPGNNEFALGFVIEDRFFEKRPENITFTYKIDDKEVKGNLDRRSVKVITSEGYEKSLLVYYLDMSKIKNIINGTHKISIIATDDNGLSNQLETTFVVDTEAPVIDPVVKQIEGLDNAYYNSETLRIGAKSNFEFEIPLNPASSKYKDLSYVVTYMENGVEKSTNTKYINCLNNDNKNKQKVNFKFYDAFGDTEETAINEVNRITALNGDTTKFKVQFLLAKQSGLGDPKEIEVYFDKVDPVISLTVNNNKVGDDKVYTDNHQFKLEVLDKAFIDKKDGEVQIVPMNGNSTRVENYNKIIIDELYMLTPQKLNQLLDANEIPDTPQGKNPYHEYETTFDKLTGYTLSNKEEIDGGYKYTITNSVNSKTALEDGIYVAKFKVYDYVGNESEQTYKFRIDTKGPSINNFKVVYSNNTNKEINVSNEVLYSNQDFELVYDIENTPAINENVKLTISTNNELLKNYDPVGSNGKELVRNGQNRIKFKMSEVFNGSKPDLVEFNINLELIAKELKASASKNINYDMVDPSLRLTTTTKAVNEQGNSETGYDVDGKMYNDHINIALNIEDPSFTEDYTVISTGETHQGRGYGEIVMKNIYFLSPEALQSDVDISIDNIFADLNKFKRLIGMSVIKENGKYLISQDGREAYTFIDGAYVIESTVYDLAGNGKEVISYVKVEKTSPKVEIVQMLNNQNQLEPTYGDSNLVYVNNVVRVNYKVNKTITGLKDVKVKVSYKDQQGNDVVVDSLNKSVVCLETGHTSCNGTSVGQHTVEVKLKEYMPTDKKENIELKVQFEATSNTEKTGTDEGEYLFFDIEENDNDKASFYQESKKLGEGSPLLDIAGSNQTLQYNYSSPAVLFNDLKLNNNTDKNSVKINSVKKSVIESNTLKEYEIYNENPDETSKASVVSSVDKVDKSEGSTNNNLILLNGNGNPFTFETGKYEVNVDVIDACGNKSTSKIVFIIDTEAVNPIVNKTKTDINKNTVAVVAKKDYTPYDAKVTFNLPKKISGYKSSTVNIYYKALEGDSYDASNNLFNKLSSDVIGIDSNGNLTEDIVTESNDYLKDRRFTLDFGNLNAVNNGAFKEGHYKVEIDTKSKAINEATGDYYNYNESFEIVVDFTNPTIKVTANNCREGQGKWFSNYTTNSSTTNSLGVPSINYTVTENNFDKVTNISTANDCNILEQNQDITFEYLSQNQKEYTVSVAAQDLSGRTGTSNTITYVYDITPPVITPMSDSNFNHVNEKYYTNKVRPYDYSATDTYLDKDVISVNNQPINKGASISGDGEKNILITAVDFAGNEVKTNPFSFILDTIAPEIKQAGLENEKYYNIDVKSDITYTDTNLDKNSYTAKLNGNSYQSGSTVSKEGEYSLEYQVADFAGNVSKDLVKFFIDKTAPVITVKGIKEDELQGGIVKPQIEVDDPTATVTSQLNGQDYVGTPIEGKDKYTLIVLATDKANNKAKKATTFMLDSTKPQIIFDDFEEGQVVKPGFVPNITATKGAKVTMLLNGNPYDGGSIDEEGDYVLEVIATDELGNETKTEFKFTVKNTLLATADGKINPFVYAGIGIVVLIAISSLIVVIMKRRKTNVE